MELVETFYEDSELLKDEQLFNRLIEDYGNDVFRLALTYVKNKDIAEDIVFGAFRS